MEHKTVVAGKNFNEYHRLKTKNTQQKRGDKPVKNVGVTRSRDAVRSKSTHQHVSQQFCKN
jgi:hypothetical protein